MNLIDQLDAKSLRNDIPDFRPGDTVMGRQGSGVRETFTVRKVSFGVGVERTFPVHSPIIDKIELVSRGDVRRAKLYYMRDRHGKAARIREKRDSSASSK